MLVTTKVLLRLSAFSLLLQTTKTVSTSKTRESDAKLCLKFNPFTFSATLWHMSIIRSVVTKRYYTSRSLCVFRRSVLKTIDVGSSKSICLFPKRFQLDFFLKPVKYQRNTIGNILDACLETVHRNFRRKSHIFEWRQSLWEIWSNCKCDFKMVFIWLGEVAVCFNLDLRIPFFWLMEILSFFFHEERSADKTMFWFSQLTSVKFGSGIKNLARKEGSYALLLRCLRQEFWILDFFKKCSFEKPHIFFFARFVFFIRQHGDNGQEACQMLLLRRFRIWHFAHSLVLGELEVLNPLTFLLRACGIISIVSSINQLSDPQNSLEIYPRHFRS